MTQLAVWTDFLSSIASVWPADHYRDLGVVVGCSGGADSVALLRGLVELSNADADKSLAAGFFVVAHFDHGFRGADSDADADFVRELARELDVRFENRRGTRHRRDEQSARNDRRQFFHDVLGQHGARYLALGHSLDDNVETVLHRLLRGTGPSGLTGMAPFRPFSSNPAASDFVVARPMLRIRRDLIRDALTQRGYPWREDTSNQSTRYRRNWIRNELLPIIQTEFPDATAAIGRAIQGQRQWNAALDPQVDQWLVTNRIQKDPLVIRTGAFGREQQQGTSLDGASLIRHAVTIEALRRCWLELGWPLQSIGQTQWNRLIALLSGAGPDLISLPGAVHAKRSQHHVTIHREM